MSFNPDLPKREDEEVREESKEHEKKEERSTRTDHVKEEDWEVVDKAKETNSALTSMDFVDVQKESNLENNAEKEPEDWYQTIPSTPANTPEYTPSQPSYPSSSARKSEVQKPLESTDLPPIKEEVIGEGAQDKNEVKDNLPENSIERLDLETPNSLRNSMVIAGFALIRIVVYILVFGTIGWTVAKMWRKMQNKRAKPQMK